MHKIAREPLRIQQQFSIQGRLIEGVAKLDTNGIPKFTPTSGFIKNDLTPLKLEIIIEELQSLKEQLDAMRIANKLSEEGTSSE